jgi:elongator complex protein 2
MNTVNGASDLHEPPQLLTASADGSLSIWSPDPDSGIYLSTNRLGELSAQKGATTATGSSGGVWSALWSPNGKAIASLSRTGSWRLWQYDEATQFWKQGVGISGHCGSVNGITWSSDGSYLLSTGADQTTRLHAEWKKGQKRSWHEFSRPQIHGYDLNCVTCISDRQFSSGADEKLLRVFDKPKDIARMLEELCGHVRSTDNASMPETRAAIPVLGLSNKGIDEAEVAPVANGDGVEEIEQSVAAVALLDSKDPPTEDLLSRHTLWPEHEKLYGHGSEIVEAAACPDGTVLATACRASSVEHAVIRLYDTTTWAEIKPSLSAHGLTVTRLTFSPDGHHLLSVGRDRAWALFERDALDDKKWTRILLKEKAHTRMILDACWLGSGMFTTAGRDKTIKIWSRGANSVDYEFKTIATISRKSPVTAVTATHRGQDFLLAAGEDDGTLSLHVISPDNGERTSVICNGIDVPMRLCCSKTINRLAWRPNPGSEDGPIPQHLQLAVAGTDASVRIVRVDLELLMACLVKP